MILKDFKVFAINKISSISKSPTLDVEVFFTHFLGLNKTQQLLNRDKILNKEELEVLNDAIQKRCTGLPVAYITGHKEFFGYDFCVTPSVLIPKPDTELLVEFAINKIIEKIEARNGSLSSDGKILTVCDMCTGSGCVGLSVLLELITKYKIRPEQLPKFVFVDISNDALEIAKLNAKKLLKEDLHYDSSEILLSKVEFIQSNLFELIEQSFDVILSNPPYVPQDMVNELLQDGRSEPRLALDGDVDIYTGNNSFTKDGLAIIRVLIEQVTEHLNSFGSFILEAGEYNVLEAQKLIEKQNFTTQIYFDLENQPRGVVSDLAN